MEPSKDTSYRIVKQVEDTRNGTFARAEGAASEAII
jgi:hypothetical protein